VANPWSCHYLHFLKGARGKRGKARWNSTSNKKKMDTKRRAGQRRSFRKKCPVKTAKSKEGKCQNLCRQENVTKNPKRPATNPSKTRKPPRRKSKGNCEETVNGGCIFTHALISGERVKYSLRGVRVCGGVEGVLGGRTYLLRRTKDKIKPGEGEVGGNSEGAGRRNQLEFDSWVCHKKEQKPNGWKVRTFC